ncbi:hypothetical protein U1701_17575 [Sphingomonas sp. PB2P19]|uniref:hypothetical protein n=1 Tax=Sphingomonas rhamnosi TaxID=3096156 RepID=UPI002FC94DFF
MASELNTNNRLLPAALASGAHAFLSEASASADLPYSAVKARLDRLPADVMPLLLGAEGWTIIANAIGISFAPTVH